jgi:Family of unknown function (DUF5677)
MHDKFEQVRCFINKLVNLVDMSEIYPRTNLCLDRVLLALLSKGISVGRAVCALVEKDFPDEAFGLSRTLIDVFFTVRYITNRDSFQRSEKYAKFTLKESEGWNSLMQKYYGRPAGDDPKRLEEILRAAKEYPNPISWTGKGGNTKHMAMEEDSFETYQDTNIPLTFEFTYEVVYKWTSYYVHPTASSLEAHIIERGEPFRVNAGNRKGVDVGSQALFVTTMELYLIFCRVFRSLGLELPQDLGDEGLALMKSI